MWMNVRWAQIAVMMMQLATTIQGVIPAFATLDLQAMDLLALVSAFIFKY